MLFTSTWGCPASVMFLEFFTPSSTCCLHPRTPSCYSGIVVAIAAVVNRFESLRGRLSWPSYPQPWHFWATSSSLPYFKHRNIIWVPGNSSYPQITFTCFYIS
ncbi:hypothetical protein F5X99DRAFT_366170 [Biscogniauxia marginata]|nr:hypothetical protein F5X99DRAFT_366170 [Biscogniauxia marginata]